MEWFVLFMLIAIGLVLLILEFLVFPGVNVAGILGFACVVGAVWLAYSTMGTTVGHFTLLGTALCGFGVTYYVLRSKTWRRMQLHTQIDSTVEGVDESIREGDIGMTQGRLAPMGKVRVGDSVVEAESRSGYFEESREVIVLKVYNNMSVVKLKTE